MLLLITGATGFVGRAVLARCAADSTFQLRGACRRAANRMPDGVESVLVGDLCEGTDWSCALNGVDAIVHTAARVHVMHDAAVDPLAEFRRVNVAGTLGLARQAAAAGVRRLIFISSIKVNGEHTSPGQPYTPDDVPAPADAYGVSKSEAEQGLRQIADETGLEVVIIRPVLVYGPGVKANFLSMMRWLSKGLPLPFGATADNRRSLVALDNLTDLILTCLHHPSAANQTFLVSDGEDLSTTALLRRTAVAMGKRPRLIPVSPSFLQTAMRLTGQRNLAERLCGSLQVDITKTRELLEWTPPVTTADALRQTGAWFLQLCSGPHGGPPLGRD